MSGWFRTDLVDVARDAQTPLPRRARDPRRDVDTIPGDLCPLQNKVAQIDAEMEPELSVAKPGLDRECAVHGVEHAREHRQRLVAAHLDRLAMCIRWTGRTRARCCAFALSALASFPAIKAV